jgi:hypothetical protein
VGDIIKLSGGAILRAIAIAGDGTTGSTEPIAPSNLRGTVVDNNVTWQLFGGHLHDGLNADGSAPPVLLTGAAEVTGSLPVANQVEHVHSGAEGQFAKINLDGAANVTGVLPAANVGGIDAITATGTFNATFPTGKTVTINYRIFSGSSPLIKWFWSDLTGMDLSASQAASGKPVPEALQPGNQRRFSAQGNGANTGIYFLIEPDGSLQLSADDSSSQFTTLYSGVGEYVL